MKESAIAAAETYGAIRAELVLKRQMISNNGRVGYAGITSKGEAGYRIISRRASALTDLQKLLAVGTPEARLHALVGIRAKDPKGFGKFAQSFRQSQADVRTQRGCIIQDEPFALVLKEIEAGDYSAFQGPFQSNRD